jgi:hypothetical protein
VPGTERSGMAPSEVARFHEPEALADFLHVEPTRLAPQAHFCRLYPHSDAINCFTLVSMRSRTPRNSSGVMSLGSGICQSTRCLA